MATGVDKGGVWEEQFWISFEVHSRELQKLSIRLAYKTIQDLYKYYIEAHSTAVENAIWFPLKI